MGTKTRTKKKSTALAKPTARRQLTFVLSLPGAGPTTLILPDQLSFAKWGETMEKVRQVGTAAMWWAGDGCQYGEHTYGEEYAQAVAGFEPGQLAKLVRVALRVPTANRRLDLSWTHHAEVASLEPAEQKGWLARAVKERWSAKELRGAIKGAKDGAASPARGGGDGLGLSCCPGCGCEGAKRTGICCKPKAGQGDGGT